MRVVVGLGAHEPTAIYPGDQSRWSFSAAIACNGRFVARRQTLGGSRSWGASRTGFGYLRRRLPGVSIPCPRRACLELCHQRLNALFGDAKAPKVPPHKLRLLLGCFGTEAGVDAGVQVGHDCQGRGCSHEGPVLQLGDDGLASFRRDVLLRQKLTQHPCCRLVPVASSQPVPRFAQETGRLLRRQDDTFLVMPVTTKLWNPHFFKTPMPHLLDSRLCRQLGRRQT